MRLKSISIQNFKSLEEESIKHPSALNVFVGKNNSGKSNILKAIDLFFQFFNTDTISKELGELGSQLDFFDRDTDRKILICCELSLGDQTSTVIKALSASAPQFSKLFEQDPTDASLSITLTSVNAEGEIFTYLSSIYLNDVKMYDLISIDDATGYELLKRTQYLNTLETDKTELQKFLDRFDSDDWAMMRPDSKGPPSSRPQRPSLNRFLVRFFDQIRSDTMANVERIVQVSESYSSFREDLIKLIDSIEEEKKNTNEQDTDTPITTFSGKQYEIPSFYWEITKIVRQINVLHLKDRREPIGRAEADKLLQLKVQRGGTKKLEKIQNTVDALLGVTVDAFASSAPTRPAPYDQRKAELDVDDFLVNVNGAGIREALRLILDYEFSQPDILLLEDPEVHLHPGLEVAMMQYLLSISERCQIFVTTHSTNFIESDTSQNIYFVAKQKATSIPNLNWGDVVDKVPGELGIQLSSLFMFEVLVFVEGKTDEAVLRRLAETLDYNINKNSVGFINMEGIRNFGNFAVNDVLEFLKTRGLDLYFVADRDEKDKDTVDLFKSKIGGMLTLP